jgi:hypothetical protein
MEMEVLGAVKNEDGTWEMSVNPEPLINATGEVIYGGREEIIAAISATCMKESLEDADLTWIKTNWNNIRVSEKPVFVGQDVNRACELAKKYGAIVIDYPYTKLPDDIKFKDGLLIYDPKQKTRRERMKKNKMKSGDFPLDNLKLMAKELSLRLQSQFGEIGKLIDWISYRRVHLNKNNFMHFIVAADAVLIKLGDDERSETFKRFVGEMQTGADATDKKFGEWLKEKEC